MHSPTLLRCSADAPALLIGSPQRLQLLASLDGLPPASSEPEDVARAATAHIEELQSALLESQHELRATREAMAAQAAELSEARAALAEAYAGRDDAALAITIHEREASYACAVLLRLLQRTGQAVASQDGASGEASASPADASGEASAEVRHDHVWIESAALRLSEWADAQKRREAAAILSEEKLHAAARQSVGRASAGVDEERKRADRAEARCQHLVAALRSMQRRYVDEEAEAPVDERPNWEAASAYARHREHVMWERGRAREAEAERMQAAQRKRMGLALRHSLALPGMAASLVHPC